jgi:hypothetical protein
MVLVLLTLVVVGGVVATLAGSHDDGTVHYRLVSVEQGDLEDVAERVNVDETLTS